jgi:hypothetical protein
VGVAVAVGVGVPNATAALAAPAVAATATAAPAVAATATAAPTSACGLMDGCSESCARTRRNCVDSSRSCTGGVSNARSVRTQRRRDGCASHSCAAMLRDASTFGGLFKEAGPIMPDSC